MPCRCRLVSKDSRCCVYALMAQDRVIVIEKLENTETPQRLTTRGTGIHEHARRTGCARYEDLAHKSNVPRIPDNPVLTCIKVLGQVLS